MIFSKLVCTFALTTTHDCEGSKPKRTLAHTWTHTRTTNTCSRYEITTTTTTKKTDLVKTLYYSSSPKNLFGAVDGCSNKASISSNSSGKHNAFPELVSQ